MGNLLTRSSSVGWASISLIIVLALIACGGNNASADVTVPPWTEETGSLENADCVVKIGFVSSFSGKDADRAPEVINGYKLAVQEINQGDGINGCKIDPVLADDRSSTDYAEVIITKLAKEDVPLIIGTFSAQVTVKLVPEVSRHRIPLLAHNGTTFSITGLGYDWVFRTIRPSSDTIDMLLEYGVTRVLTETAPPSMAIVYENTIAGNSFAVAALSKAKELGVSVVAAEMFGELDTYPDFIEQMSRVKAANPDILFLSSNQSENATNIMQACEELGINPQIYLTNAGVFTSEGFVTADNYHSDYLVSAVPWVPQSKWVDTTGQPVDELIDRFTAKYGVAPGYRGVNAYVNVYLAKYVIQSVVNQNRDITLPLDQSEIEKIRVKIRDELRDLDVENTPFGPVNFDDRTGQNPQPAMLVQNYDGAFRVISPTGGIEAEAFLPVLPWSARE